MDPDQRARGEGTNGESNASLLAVVRQPLAATATVQAKPVGAVEEGGHTARLAGSQAHDGVTLTALGAAHVLARQRRRPVRRRAAGRATATEIDDGTHGVNFPRDRM